MIEESLADSEIPIIAHVDLTAHEVFQHFVSSGKRGQLLAFLLALDRYDTWAVDFQESTSPQVFDIQQYLQELSDFVGGSVTVLHRVPAELAEVLAHLTTTRCMYLIRFIGQRNPEFLDALARLLEQDGGANPNISAIRRRFQAFSNGNLLGEMFSGARLRRIVAIMGSNEE
jgi:hypothetical protein